MKEKAVLLLALAIGCGYCISFADTVPGAPPQHQKILIRICDSKIFLKPRTGEYYSFSASKGMVAYGEKNFSQDENPYGPAIKSIQVTSVDESFSFARDVEKQALDYDYAFGDTPYQFLSVYDQIWDLRFSFLCGNAECPATLTEHDKFMYRKFLARGGGILLVGNEQLYRGRNNGICDFVSTVMASGTFGPVTATTSCGSSWMSSTVSLLPNLNECALAEDFAQDYNGITDTARNGSKDGRIEVYYAGVVTSWGSGHPLYTYPMPDGRMGAVVVAFTPQDLAPLYRKSKLMVVFDEKIFLRQFPVDPRMNLAFIENTYDFLTQSPRRPALSMSPTLTQTLTETLLPTLTAAVVHKITPSLSASPTRTRTVRPARLVTTTQVPTPRSTATLFRTRVIPSAVRTSTVLPTETPIPSIKIEK